MKTLIIDGKLLKQLPINDHYYISEFGDVYSTYAKKFLKHDIDNDGYHRISCKRKHYKIHRLVYMTWVGEIPKGKQINHIDDNKDNNHYLNLYAGNQVQNIQDCKDNNHRCGNTWYITLYDKEKDEIISFCPAQNFVEYCGHTNKSKAVKKFFNKNWFKKRYEIIEYRKINSNKELKSVTTIPDECMEVGVEISTTDVLGNEASENRSASHTDKKV